MHNRATNDFYDYGYYGITVQLIVFMATATRVLPVCHAPPVRH